MLQVSDILLCFVMGGLDDCVIFFFFNDTATTEIYTLSLHDALPIYDFRQNRRPKVFSEKIAIFTRRGPVNNVKTLKT